MRRDVLRTWTAASLLAFGLVAAGAATTYGFRRGGDGAPGVQMSLARIEHCAVPAARARQTIIGRASAPREGAAMLLLLFGERARLVGALR